MINKPPKKELDDVLPPIRINGDVKDQFKIYCNKRGKTMSSVIIEYVEKLLAETLEKKTRIPST